MNLKETQIDNPQWNSAEKKNYMLKNKKKKEE